MFTGAIPQRNLVADKTFASLGLTPRTLARLAALGFEHPTPVQVEVIPRALAGQDLIGLAQTGSGKTAAFSLPMLERLGRGRGVRGLVVCPTREIALQNQGFLDALSEERLTSVCIIGGVRMNPQISGLRRDPDVVVATPGRLLDHMRRRHVGLGEVETLVLDEADHMFDLGFLPQLTRILEAVPRKRQTMMFSATMPAPIERLASRFMREPVRVDLRPAGRAAEGIEHRLYLVREDDKKPCLLEIAEREPESMIVFVRRKIDAEWICRQLELAGHPVVRMHSDRSQQERVAALTGIRQGEHRILVATDIAARGIDLPIIQHIVNLDVPETVEDYVHRAGRTARGASGGTVSTIATWRDKPMIREIEEALGQELPRESVPGIEPYRETDAAGEGPRSGVRGRRQRRRRRLL